MNNAYRRLLTDTKYA